MRGQAEREAPSTVKDHVLQFLLHSQGNLRPETATHGKCGIWAAQFSGSILLGVQT
jgi:hypothetical protein